MQFELIANSGAGKYTQPIPSDLQPMMTKYQRERFTPTNEVDPDDLERLLERYAVDPLIDLNSICIILNISHRQLATLQNRKEFKDLYEEIQQRRAEMLLHHGYMVARLPFDNVVSGKECTPELLKSSKQLSNYLLSYSQSIGNRKSNANMGGTINLKINLPTINGLDNGGNQT